jgi:hypothetical protein
MKTNLSISLRWRMAIVLLLLLWGVGGAFAQVSVTNLATDYAAKKISFTVSWTATPHNNQIWVITDYVKVENATTVGGWSRALVTGATATGNGSAATVTGQRGFWLNTSASSGSATITATLSGIPAQFNWCAYALNYPPRAVIKAAGGYDLKGTPPFTVNGVPLAATATTYGAGTCITSLSDATNNPTSVLPAAPTVSTSNPAARCGAGAVTLNATAGGGTTTAMTYTWVVGGGAAQATTIGSLPLSSVAEGSTTYSVTVTNANGCTSAAKSGTITVHTAVATASISGNSSNTCPASTVSLSASASGATSFTWYRNGTQVQTGASSAYTVTSSGSYTVQGKNAICTGTTSSNHVVTINGCGDVEGCTGLQLYHTTSAYDGAGTWSTANTFCTSRRARLPTRTELECMCTNRGNLPSGYQRGYYYWSSTADGSSYYVVLFGSSLCDTDYASAGSSIYFRCVL